MSTFREKYDCTYVRNLNVAVACGVVQVCCLFRLGISRLPSLARGMPLPNVSCSWQHESVCMPMGLIATRRYLRCASTVLVRCCKMPNHAPEPGKFTADLSAGRDKCSFHSDCQRDVRMNRNIGYGTE